MRISQCPKSTSVLGSLYAVLRYSSKCSLEHISLPLFFWPSSCFVNWNGMAIKAGLFCALSLLRLRWYSVKSIALNSANGPLSSSLAFLCCFLRTFSSCRMLWIFSALLFLTYGCLTRYSSVPNLSAAKALTTVVIVCSLHITFGH